MSELSGNELLIVATIRDEISAGLTVIREELKATARAEAEVGASGAVAAAGLDRASSPKYVAGLRAIETANRGVWRSMLTGKTVAGGLAIAIAAVGVAGTVMSAKFDAAMARVHTQAGASLAEVKSLRGGVLSLAGQVGVGPDELALSLYHVESAGFRGAQALDLVRYAAEGARIGNANLEDTTQAMIAATASQIKGVHGAADAMGQLNAIVGTGDMKMEQLARAMATGILPSASVAGLSLRDVGAALATITDNATPADEAATRLRMTFALMSAPTDKAIKALGSIGIGSDQLARDMRKPDGLLVAVTDLRSHLMKLPGGVTGVDAARVVEQAFGGGRTSGAILTLLTQYDRLQQKYADLRKANPAQELADSWRVTQATTVQQVHRIEASVQSLGIRIGDWLMPYVNRGLGGLERGLQGLPHAAASAWHLIGPIIIDNVHQLEHLAHLVMEIGHDLSPLGQLFLLAFGGGLIVLHGLAAALAAIAGFLDHHRIIVYAIAALYAVRLVPAILEVIAGLRMWMALTLVEWMAGATGAVQGLRAAFIGLASAEAVATLGLTAVVGLVMHGINVYKKWGDGLKDVVSQNSGVGKSYAQLGGELQKYADKASKAAKPTWHSSFTDPFGGARHGAREAQKAIDQLNWGVSFLATKFKTTKEAAFDFAQVSGVDLTKQTTAGGISVQAWGDHITTIASNLGVSVDTVRGAVTALGPEVAKQLTHPWAEDGAAIQAVTDYVDGLGKQAGLTLPQMKAAVGDNIEKMQALAKAVDDAGQATAQSMGKATDVLSNLDAGESLDHYYKRTIRQATRFNNEIIDATRRGLDPHLITRFLQAGPQAAGPVLDQLVRGHGNRMIRLANQSERALAAISAKAVEMSRLTTIAIQSGTDRLTRDLAAGMKIDSEALTQGAGATVATVARALHMKEADVYRIGQEFGLTFTNGFDAGAAANPPVAPKPRLAGGVGGAGRASDTHSPRGLPSHDLGRTMAFHAAISARSPGVQRVSSAQRSWGLGSAWSDHLYGRAADIVGSGLPTYQAMARAAGAFAEFHGSGADHHLHVVPGAGDTAGPRIPAGGGPGPGGAGVSVLVSLAPGTVVVQGSNASPAEIEDAAARGVEKGARRGIERARVPSNRFGAH